MRKLIALMALTACMQAPAGPVSNPVSNPVPDPVPEGAYRLISVNAAPFPARATISFATPGMVSGQAPCNSYSGSLTATLPQFATDGVMSTEMACDALADEGVFFAALAAMTRADISTAQVILRNPAGGSMVFVQP